MRTYNYPNFVYYIRKQDNFPMYRYSSYTKSSTATSTICNILIKSLQIITYISNKDLMESLMLGCTPPLWQEPHCLPRSSSAAPTALRPPQATVQYQHLYSQSHTHLPRAERDGRQNPVCIQGPERLWEIHTE